MTEMGLFGYAVPRGIYNKGRCERWLRLVLESSGVHFTESSSLLCDNAPCHTDLERIFQSILTSQDAVLRLAHYSPQLNLSKGIWNIIKAYVKQVMRQRYAEMLRGDLDGVLRKTEWRMQLLEQIVAEARACVTPHHC